jgi:hypothetical protein
MWTFNSSNGCLSYAGGLIFTDGWSGHDVGRNNPTFEGARNLGPIPRGMWTIGDSIDSEKLGCCVMPLTPAEGTETFGRGGFFIHGASSQHTEESSHGCIILPRSIRMGINLSEDKELQVV